MPKWRVDVLLLRNRQPQGAVEAETVINKLRLPELPEVERAASESCWRPSGNVNKTSCFWRFSALLNYTLRHHAKITFYIF